MNSTNDKIENSNSGNNSFITNDVSANAKTSFMKPRRVDSKTLEHFKVANYASTNLLASTQNIGG